MNVENLTISYVTRAEVWLCITTLLYFLMNGAQIFETLVFVPKWASSPPQNFKLLLDGNGASLKVFWIVLHSIHEVAFILSIIFCWKIDPVKNWLLVLFILHVMVRVWTLSFFAPQIIDFQKIAESQQFPKDLLSRVSLWQKLNYVRVLIFIIISLGLIPLCVKLFQIRL
ncbi:transposase [Chryseobacterium sp. T16E-39]|uniref:transposase n=1 Tax=Chryseobacterium sp. T16E-39 TaxID=2015076 RepID=UPI000B5B3D3D|nr:transposase [Chryseobacterium sp. T16E-39]ASK28704.1 transposase [Chryseobacterium sp. T16E-39]